MLYLIKSQEFKINRKEFKHLNLGLEHNLTPREDIYRRCSPENEAIPILVQPADISDGHLEGGRIL